MAHIPDGVLHMPVLAGGAVVAAAMCAWALWRCDVARLMPVAALAAVALMSSLIMIPLGPTSVHLMLGGLLGAMLGRQAVLAILMVLLLQAIFLGYGGIATLGVNLVNLAFPSLLGGMLARAVANRGWPAMTAGALAGLAGVTGTALLLGLTLALGGNGFDFAAKVIAMAYLPLGVIEAVVCGAALQFIARVAPQWWLCEAGEP